MESKMRDYLERFRGRGTRGFTLMEMLIVVAIIAVLIAIAIPVFTSQLENSREATDAANIRAAYAEVTAAALEGSTELDTSVPWSDHLKKYPDIRLMDDVNSPEVKWYAKEVSLTQQQNDWTNSAIAEQTIGGKKISEINLSDLASVTGVVVECNRKGDVKIFSTTI